MFTRRFLWSFAVVVSLTALLFACVHMPTYAPQNPAVKNEMHSGEYRDAVSDYHEKLFNEGREISGTTPSAVKTSGAASCGSIKRSPANDSAASATASSRRTR